MLLECFNLTLFVNGSTRSKGHTLDLVIANELFDQIATNLSCLSLLATFLESVVPLQLHNHLSVNNLFEQFQSGF